MNFKLSLAALLFGTAFLFVPGCAADASDDAAPADTADSEEELTAAASNLVGAFHFAKNDGDAPTFHGVVFKANGEFFADVDTGIRCITAPCPSNVRLEGSFKATRTTLTLSPKSGDKAHAYNGKFKYKLSGQSLSLTRTGAAWRGWGNELTKEISYCAEASDCGGQMLIVPACVGHFVCGEQRACGFDCGI